MPTIQNLGSDMAGENVLSTIDRADRLNALSPEDEEEDDDDETLTERLWGLTEMFPEPVRNGTHYISEMTKNSCSWLWDNGRKGSWVLASSVTILFLPVIFEIGRVDMEKQLSQQQRQVLLGPNAAVAGGAGGPGMMPGMPPMPPTK